MNVFKIVITKLISFLNCKIKELALSALSFKSLLTNKLSTAIKENVDQKTIDASKREKVKEFIGR